MNVSCLLNEGCLGTSANGLELDACVLVFALGVGGFLLLSTAAIYGNGFTISSFPSCDGLLTVMLSLFFFFTGLAFYS